MCHNAGSLAGPILANILRGAVMSSNGTFAIRVAGTATLNIDQGELNSALEPCVTCFMTLKVVGFKQSRSVGL